MIIGSSVRWTRKLLPKYAKEEGIKLNKTYVVSGFTVFSVNNKLQACVQVNGQRKSTQWFYLTDFDFYNKG